MLCKGELNFIILYSKGSEILSRTIINPITSNKRRQKLKLVQIVFNILLSKYLIYHIMADESHWIGVYSTFKWV